MVNILRTIIRGDMDLRTPLAKVKGYGSAKSGTESHILQRISAVGMIFLWLWFVVITLKFIGASDVNRVYMVNNPFTLLGFILFGCTAIYHASFGLQMIIEDYIHCDVIKFVLVGLVKFFCFATVVAGVVGAFVIHITSF
jgi:succinate dehydrogenase / fumarate reductase membrane anchor subunit